MRHWLIAMLALAASAASAQTGVDMLPAGAEYDPSVPEPAEILGFRVGAQHVRHDQLVAYFRALADASDRVTLATTGRTHEGREQLLAIVTSPANHADLEGIRTRHLAAARGEREPDGPAVIWQGYSVHGDEASGADAALLYAYHLAAGRDPSLVETLEDVVVLVDPALNPDGLGRYVAWATSRRGETQVTDPAHDESNQPWPSGRGNHYWFDLNRDWLLLQHPESRHRVAVHERWRPHVFTDHHEMGRERTYFFQPGVPERTHPLTSERNQALTARIAEFHAEALDAAGRRYYTRESYDDFYYGKGSTYPDITGGIGILFEQASTDGQAVETPHGVRSFRQSVHNQLLTSLSTLEAAFELRAELLDYQARFFAEARDEAGRGAWIVGDGGNPARLQAFLQLLAGHGIRFRPLAERVEAGAHAFEPGRAWVVPADQFHARLVEALFETRTEFPSHVFYDVSAWTLPLAFDLPFANRGRAPDAGDWHDAAPALSGRFNPDPGAVAYAFSWRHDRAPATLQALLAEDVRASAATKPLTVRAAAGVAELDRGAVVVPLGGQDGKRETIERTLRAAAEDGLTVHAVRSGLAADGVDLGSPSLAPLEPIKPLLVTGRGVNPYEAGEVWHLADIRLSLPLTQVERARLGDVELADYTHVILVGGIDGEFKGWSEEQAVRLHQWLAAGGILIAQQEAARWVTDFRLQLPPEQRALALEEAGGEAGFAGAKLQAELEERREADAPERRDYAEFRDDRAEALVSGTIFQADADLTHPLAFGIADRDLAVFKNRHQVLEVSDNPYATVVRFADEPLIAGYVSEERKDEIAGSAALLADKVGEGLLVRSSINPTFRAVWRGTERLMVNALYFGQAVRATEMP